MSFKAEYRDLASPKLKQILGSLQPAQRKAMLQRLAAVLERDLIKHFRARNKEGNKQGFPRSNWWEVEVAQKTSVRSVTSDEATIGINSPQFRFKLTGGTIRPGPGKKFLAIPMRAEAKGHRPSQDKIPGLFFKRIGGRAYLAARDGSALRVYWKLVPSVTQPADPRALPPVEQLRAALDRVAEQEVRRIVQQ